MQESLKRARLGTSVLFFLHGLIVSTWLSRIPAVQSRLGLNAGQLGLALLGTAIGALISMPLTGMLVARFGSRPVAISSTVFMAGSLSLLPLAGTQWLLTGALAIFGIFAGAMNVSMNAQAVFLEQQYGRAIMSSFHALFSLGGMSGASLGGFAAAHGMPPRLHFAIGSVTYAITALAAGPMLLSADKGRKGAPVFARLSRPLLGLGCLAFCILLNEGAMADWSSVYLRRSLQTTEATAAAGYAVFSFAMAGGRLLGDWITERTGRVHIVRYGASVAAVGLGIGLFLGNVPATFAGFAAAGAGFSVIVPLTFVAAGRNTASAALGLAAVNTAGYLGFLSGPAVIGFTANTFGLREALFLVVFLSLLVASLAQVVHIPEGAHAAREEEPVLQ